MCYPEQSKKNVLCKQNRNVNIIKGVNIVKKQP